MNPCIQRLFDNREMISKLAELLPFGFELAASRFSGSNPAIGKFREDCLAGFFASRFGGDMEPADSGTTRGLDIRLCGEPISIKTRTGDGAVKVIWTADSAKVKEEYKRFSPDCDILLINIFWKEIKDSIFFFTKEVQCDTMQEMTKDKYLKVGTGTNHRGIEISADAIRKMKSDERTLRHQVHWKKMGLNTLPYLEWKNMWDEDFVTELDKLDQK